MHGIACQALGRGERLSYKRAVGASRRGSQVKGRKQLGTATIGADSSS